MLSRASAGPIVPPQPARLPARQTASSSALIRLISISSRFSIIQKNYTTLLWISQPKIRRASGTLEAAVEKPEILDAGKEDRYERNPSGGPFVQNHTFFRDFQSSKKLAQLGEKTFSPSCLGIALAKLKNICYTVMVFSWRVRSLPSNFQRPLWRLS
jgi:hypothetical protein